MMIEKKKKPSGLRLLSFSFEIQWTLGVIPAQKWIKDRKGRILDFEDIMHYRSIIKALIETDKVMKEIDGVVFWKGVNLNEKR